MRAAGPGRDVRGGAPALRRHLARCLIIAGGSIAAGLLVCGIASANEGGATDTATAPQALPPLPSTSGWPSGSAITGAPLAGLLPDPADTVAPPAAASTGLLALPGTALTDRIGRPDPPALPGPAGPPPTDVAMAGSAVVRDALAVAGSYALPSPSPLGLTGSMPLVGGVVMPEPLALPARLGLPARLALPVPLGLSAPLDLSVGVGLPSGLWLPVLADLGGLSTMRPLAQDPLTIQYSGDRHQPGMVAAPPAVAAGAVPVPTGRMSARAGTGNSPVPAATPDHGLGTPSAPTRPQPRLPAPAVPTPTQTSTQAGAVSAVAPASAARTPSSGLYVGAPRHGPTATSSGAGQPGVTPD